MPLMTKRWCDKKSKSDGWRLLICRYRPRALPKEDETWDTWLPDLGPSKELHAAFYGKTGTPISWEQYRERYLTEIQAQEDVIDELAAMLNEGKTITLLCSKACVEEAHCHRILLKQLIEDRQARRTPSAEAAAKSG